MSAGQVAGKAEQFGRRTENSEWFDRAVRFGLVVYGVVYLVLAWLGIQLALGNNEGKATTKGAVAQLAEQPFGTFMIILVAVGMFLLVLWRLFDLFLGHHEDDSADLWKHRASDLLKALLYGTVCWSAVSVLIHSGGGGSGAKDFSSTILELPGGQVWLTLIGLGIIAYGGNQIYLAWNEKHQKKLATEGTSGEAGKAERVGRRTENSEWFDKAVRFGLVVYGIVYLVLAWLGIQLALGNNEGKATTKGAVAQLAEQPFGTFMIVVVAVGMFLLVLWRLFDLFLGHHEDDSADCDP